VHRPDDGEHVGYLAPLLAGELVLPVALHGVPLGPPQLRGAATALLRTRGLAVLDRRWFCRLPMPLPPGVLPAGEAAPEWSWRPVVLVEVSPADCRVRPAYPAPEELTSQASLPVPVGGRVLPEPPAA
jgi:hypothetical protein